MNQFIYKNTVILKSHFDFSQFKSEQSFEGEVSQSTAVTVPKDVDTHKTVFCTIELSFGKKDDPVNFSIQARSFFEIDGDINMDTLKTDMKELCYPTAASELSEKIANLSRLHIGINLNIPIPEKL